VIVLAVAVAMLAAGLAYERYRRKQDLRVLRSLLAEESANRIIADRSIDATAAHVIGRLQRQAIAIEDAIVNIETAMLYQHWRLLENGVLDADDAPPDNVEVTH
jgi:hypothetical protein